MFSQVLSFDKYLEREIVLITTSEIPLRMSLSEALIIQFGETLMSFCVCVSFDGRLKPTPEPPSKETMGHNMGVLSQRVSHWSLTDVSLTNTINNFNIEDPGRGGDDLVLKSSSLEVKLWVGPLKIRGSSRSLRFNSCHDDRIRNKI